MSTDASKLSFPIQLVIMMLTAAGSIWASQYGLRSDVRDIRTRMEMQARIDEMQAKLIEERAAGLRQAVEAMQRRQELQQYEIQGLKEAILKQGAKP